MLIEIHGCFCLQACSIAPIFAGPSPVHAGEDDSGVRAIKKATREHLHMFNIDLKTISKSLIDGVLSFVNPLYQEEFLCMRVGNPGVEFQAALTFFLHTHDQTNKTLCQDTLDRLNVP